ncbi:MoaB/Mog domain-containing protein [Pisolithus tinctorius]|nr:MoaB/Mog domain-containing protein [Pisolithus tinctorius]
MSFSAGVITAGKVSDSVHAGVNEDKSGPLIQDILRTRGFERVVSAVASDDEESIRASLKLILSLKVDCVFTTGGTGFGERDITPEASMHYLLSYQCAISPLLERQAPGLVHLLLSSSLKHTPLAVLSRPLAGTIGKTLVVTLPGSTKAVRENLDALLSNGVLDHALDLTKGGSGKVVHAALGSGHTPIVGEEHACGHHHRPGCVAPKPRTTLSHDPSVPAPGRLRVTAGLTGHVLAEDVRAPQDIPSSKTTNVDGYAVRSSDTPGVYNVLTSRTHKLSEELPEGSIFRINTGGPLPAASDSVIMVEDTELESTLKDADGEDAEEEQVKTLAQVSPGENVREPGSDVRQGDLVMQMGEVITSAGGEVGTLAFVGRKEVKVVRKPVVALLSTGNELLDLQSPKPMPGDGWGGIWDTNRPSLQAALEGMGYKVIDLGIVADDVDAHVRAVSKGLETADILLTTGGTSMGASDLLKPVIERRFNGTIHFGRVAIKPGKPTTFASIATKVAPHGRKYLFALPGNPTAAIVTFHIFVVPALRKLGAWLPNKCQLPRVQVQLENAMPLDPRVELHRVIVRSTPEGLLATTTGSQRSSRVTSLCGANGLVTATSTGSVPTAHLLAPGGVVDNFPNGCHFGWSIRTSARGSTQTHLRRLAAR